MRTEMDTLVMENQIIHKKDQTNLVKNKLDARISTGLND